MSPEIVEDEEASAASPPPAKKSKKKLIIIAAAAALVVLGGGGAGYVMFSSPGGDAHGETAKKSHGANAESFVDVPPIVVNLRSPDGAPRFLKIHFMLVPGAKGTSEELKAKLPLMLDAYQPFLRELRPEDLAGSAAVFRIKEEMLRRATDTLGPDQVEDILIQDLVQQ
jgi:flagellar FliL protein